MSDAKTNRNQRIMDRYNELIRQPGAHGHYETIFRIVREEVERALEGAAKTADYHASSSRLAQQGDCTGSAYLRGKEQTATSIAGAIRALRPSSADPK